MKNILCILYVSGLCLSILSCGKEDVSTVNDFDGNTYHTVKIGSQTWMLENLKVTHYNDGSPISNISDLNTWISDDSTGGYCWYNNDGATNKESYGALYNKAAVQTGKLCPAGWHIPDNEEWSELIEFLGGDTISANKLKEAGNMHWRIAGTNESGFTALPGGYRWVYFYNLTFCGHYWSSSSTPDIDKAFEISGASRLEDYPPGNGMSVRCIKD